MQDFSNYINPALLVMIPVLNIVGKFIKDATRADNRYIPLILGALAVVLASVWVLATAEIGGWRDMLNAVFCAFVQGVLTAGTAVYANQIYKQSVDKHENK